MSEIPASTEHSQALRAETRRLRSVVRKLSRGKKIDYRQADDISFVIRRGCLEKGRLPQLMLMENRYQPDQELKNRRTDVYYLHEIATRKSLIVGDEECIGVPANIPDLATLKELTQRMRRSQRVPNPPPFVGLNDLI